MTSTDKIKLPVSGELKKFDVFFKDSLKSKVALLDIITNYVLKSKGKQMRPLLVFLCAKMIGKITPATYTAAALIELLHTATLIHDDVVDNSDMRRGFFSIKAIWKTKIAVLIGDYLLSKGLLLAIDNNEFEMLRLVSDAVKKMAEGELLQIEKSRKLDINEEVYFEIIYKKTATLLESCTAGGALSAGADKETVELMKDFGKYAGLVFQIKDDLFDYQKTNLTGKPIGNDIQEKKMTLPLIYALSKCEKKEKGKILAIISKGKKKEFPLVLDFVREKGGLEYSTLKMNEYKEKAVEILNKFPESEAKNSLMILVDYIAERNK